MTLAMIGLLAAVNPAAAAWTLSPPERSWAAVAAGAVAAAAALVAVAGLSGPLVEGLDVSLGTYRLGAGVVVAVVGLRWLVAGPASPTPSPASHLGLAGFVAFPLLFTPSAAVLAISEGAEHGAAFVVAPAAVATLLGAVCTVTLARWTGPPSTSGQPGAESRSLPAVLGSAVRLLGAVGVVIGIIVAVDGVRTL